MSDLQAVDVFIHDTYFVFGWPETIISVVALAAISAGIAWAVSRRRR